MLSLLGLVPYAVLSYVVITQWGKFVGFTPLESVGFWEYTTCSLFTGRNIFGILSLLGSWASWYLFCKLCKYMG